MLVIKPQTKKFGFPMPINRHFCKTKAKFSLFSITPVLHYSIRILNYKLRYAAPFQGAKAKPGPEGLDSLLVATNPVQSLDNQAEVPSERGTGITDGFLFGRMPKKKRTMLKGLTNSSYRIMIKGKETTAMIKSLNRMPMSQRITYQPTQRIIVWWNR